jgi:sporulation protein YlmC with PRC-barrel domain
VLKHPSVVLLTLAAALTAAPVLAQQADQTGTPPSASTAVPSADSALAPPAGVVATTNNPNLAVASVRMENGVRASKLIGAAVYSDGNERVGSVDDLIMTENDKITVAVIAVGGFLGLGSKLVAVPFDQLKRDGDHVVLAGATKDTLNAMPNFIY